MIPLWAVETARANFRQSTPAALLSSTNASQATMPEPPGGDGQRVNPATDGWLRELPGI